MRGLLEAGAVLLAPALAGAVSLEDDTIPSAFITLHLPESADVAATQDLNFRFDIQESTEACGAGNVTINGQSLPEGGSGSFIVDEDRFIDATWNLTCVAWNGVPQEQLLSLNVEAMNGQSVEDVGFTLRFQQVAPVWISDVEGSASMTRVHSVNQANASCDDDEEVDVDAAIAELDYLRWQVAELRGEIHKKERRLAKALGWSHMGGPPMIADCDSIKCAFHVLYHKVKDTAYSIYGGDFLPGRHGPRPHGLMPGGPRHHEHPHGKSHGHAPFAHHPEYHGNHTQNGTHPHMPHPPHFGHPPPFCKCGPPGPPHGAPHGPPPPPGAYHHMPPPPPGAHPHMPPPPHGAYPHMPPPPPEDFPQSHHGHRGPRPQSPGDHHWRPAPEDHKDPKDDRISKTAEKVPEDPQMDAAADLPEPPTEAELRRDPYYEENHPPHHGPSMKEHAHGGPHHEADFERRPHHPSHHEPPMHDGPEDFPPPPFDGDGPMPLPPPPPFDHDGSMPPPPPFFGPDGHPMPPPPMGPDGSPMPPPPPPGGPGRHHHGPPRGMIFVHIASVAASVILLGIFIKVLTQRCAARNSSSSSFSHRRRSYSNAPWYKRLCFGPHYYSQLDDEEKEAMLRDCDSDCTSVEGDEDVVARDISGFRPVADVVGEMVTVEEGRMIAAQHQFQQQQQQHNTEQHYVRQHSPSQSLMAFSPAHSRQSSAQMSMQQQQPQPQPQHVYSPVQLNSVPIAIPDHAAAMFPDLAHDEALPAYQEADRSNDDDASELASSLMADGYRPGCSGTYTPSESGSQGASDILGDTKN